MNIIVVLLILCFSFSNEHLESNASLDMICIYVDKEPFDFVWVGDYSDISEEDSNGILGQVRYLF